MALVRKIIPQSTVDGPGNRTAVFLQGCSLNCLYCHNPETRNLCRACGQCVSVCPGGALQVQTVFGLRQTVFDPGRCLDCGACQLTCRYGASPRVRWLTAAEVWPLVERQKPFISGLTVSGGECMLQPDFLASLLRLCRENRVHTAVDTAGCVPFRSFEKILPCTDLFLYDIKLMDPEKHREYTGAGNEIILANLARLLRAGQRVWIRVPIIPGVNDTIEEMRRIRAFLTDNGYPEKVELLPFHRMGESKLAALNRKGTSFSVPDPEKMEALRKAVAQ